MLKPVSLAALAATTVALTNPVGADDRIDVGGFGGIHLFNENIELGVADTTAADSPRHSLAFGLRVGYRIWRQLSAEGELAIAPSRTREAKSDVVVFGWRAHALYHFEAGPVRPFLLGGVGALTSAPSDTSILDEDTDALFHAGVGVKYDAADTWGLRLDARSLFPPSTANKFATTDWEFFLGAYMRFPTSPAVPEAPADSDGDQVVGATDLCPDDAEDVDGYQDADGCPDRDNDGDGFEDADDPCPLEAGNAPAGAPARPCPLTDDDGDKLTDTDKCPAEAEDFDGFQDDDGCPDPDNDGDGAADADDKCPLEAEVKNGFEDDDGCPDELPADLAEVIGTPVAVQFAGRSANVRPFVSKKALERVAAVLKAHPKVAVVVVGHTDDQGTEEETTKLSQDRAEAVVAELVKLGVTQARLSAKGRGAAEPIADNADAKVRRSNNRIVLELTGATPQAPEAPNAPEAPKAPEAP